MVLVHWQAHHQNKTISFKDYLNGTFQIIILWLNQKICLISNREAAKPRQGKINECPNLNCKSVQSRKCNLQWIRKLKIIRKEIFIWTKLDNSLQLGSRFVSLINSYELSTSTNAFFEGPAIYVACFLATLNCQFNYFVLAFFNSVWTLSLIAHASNSRQILPYSISGLAIFPLFLTPEAICLIFTPSPPKKKVANNFF